MPEEEDAHENVDIHVYFIIVWAKGCHRGDAVGCKGKMLPCRRGAAGDQRAGRVSGLEHYPKPKLIRLRTTRPDIGVSLL